MPKVVNIRERVHQPFRDSLCRLSGYTQGNVQDQSKLFTVAGKPSGQSNLANGSTLPSDQSMVVLALRCMLWFRSPVQRGGTITLADGATTILAQNGDWALPAAGAAGAFAAALGGSAIADYHDVHRNYFQASEQLLWSMGAGEKFSINSMPSMYYAYGGGLAGDIGGQTDLIHWNNGTEGQSDILRLARAVLIPPRQNIRVEANIESYVNDANQNGATFGVTQETRNMLSLKDNLNAVDLMQKIITFTIDGLFSRDVQ